MSAVYFMLLLGGLIFFHELGHFLLAKAMGVKVLTFSIGFGPALVKWTWGDTEYKLAAIPLGGYVKMFGDEMGDEIADKALGISVPDTKEEAVAEGEAVPPEVYSLEEKKAAQEAAEYEQYAFNSKPLWRRTLIVLAGPAFNLILPFFVFFFMFLSHSELPSTYLGTVKEGGPGWEAGLRSGDVITKINGEEVSYWWQLEEGVNSSIDTEMAITVQRGDKSFDTAVTPEEVENVRVRQLDLIDREGRIQVVPNYVRPLLWIRPGGKAEKAGLRHWDLITHVDGKKVDSFVDVQRALDDEAEHSVVVVREEPLGQVGHAFFNRYGTPLTVQLDAGAGKGIESAEMVVHHVDEGSTAHKLGLKAGDRILSLDDDVKPLWFVFEGYLADKVGDTHELVWENDSGQHTDTFTLAPKTIKGEFNEDRQIVVFGAYNHSDHRAPDWIANDARLAYAAHHTWMQVYDAYRITFLSLVGLMAGRVPLDTMGGPILIYDMASRTEDLGWEYFFGIMVLLSVSLGVINLFPIPILDGGHLVFFLIEAIIRRPVPIKVRTIASYVGLFLILLLMVVVFKNDIARNWDKITGWFA